MSKRIDFYYDFISPASYFAFMRLLQLTEGGSVRINYKPIVLGGIFKGSGNTSPVTIPAKWDWIKADFQRQADYYGIPFLLNPHFIFSTVNAMRGALWALSEDRIEEYNRAMFSAAWEKGQDLSSHEVLRNTLTGAGFDADEVMAAIGRPAIKTALVEVTDDAVQRGVFGAPTFFVKDEMHFGQERRLYSAMERRRSSTPIRVSSSPVMPSQAFSKIMASGSAWTERAATMTTSSWNGSGAASNMSASTSQPSRMDTT